MESKVLTGGERDYSQDGSSWSSDHRRGSIPEHVNSHRRGSILEHVNDYRRGSIPEHISMTSFSSRPLRETPEPAVLRFDEGWSTSTYRMGSASTGTVFGRTEALHNHAGEKARPHPRALSRIATSTPDISRSELDLSKPSSTRARSPLLTALDPTEEEVSNAKRVELFGIPLLRLTQVNSYAVVRQTYKYHRQSHRQDKPKSFLAVASLIFDLRHYYNLLWSFVKSPSRIAIFMILDLLSDIIMSILYLIEIQWNFSHHMDTEVLERGHPRWLWVSRPNALFYIASVFSIFNLLSFLNRLLLADHKLNTIFSPVLLLELVTSVPFVVALRFDGGRLLYIPYFLRAIVAVSRMKTVLRLRGATRFLNFSVVTEKLVLVFTTIAAIIYVGLCAFQFAESNFQSDGEILNLTVMQYFYFIIVTLSTVGFGDITAKSSPGQFVVVLLIFVALSIIPLMLTNLVETISLQKAGGGSFKKGSSNYVVIIGNIDTTPKIIDVLENFLTDESEDQFLKVVIVARREAPPAVKMVINQSLYKDRVIFLVGAGLDQEDMKRFHPEGALAVFVVGDRFAVDKRREDEENTLRAWAIDDYTQQAANLYVSNLLPETKIFQEKAASGVVCIDDIKQIVLAHTSLCSGSAAVLINLIHKYTPHDQYRQTWTALYGDGAGNEMYTDEVNPAFDKQKFTDVAWYLYREFQAIMVAVLCYDKAHNEYHLLLNPGATYHFKKEDKYVLIAQGPQEISDIRNLTREEFNSSVLKDGEAYGSLKEDEESVQMFTPMTDRFEDSFFPVYEDSIIGTPSPHYSDQNVQFCHLRKTAAFLHECIIPDTQDLCDHFVVCTRHFKLFQFVCTLRAAYLTAEDVRPIVFISEQPPTETEFEVLSVFPRIYFIIGDPRTEKDLIRAGVTKARKVIIFSLSFQNGNQFSDSTSIMISHLIYSMTSDIGHRIPVVIELDKRAHIGFLQPSAIRSSRRHRRKANAATRVIDQNLGYLYTPMYASGRVVVAAMLDCLLFQLSDGNDNPVVDTFRLLSGVYLRKDVVLYQKYGLRSSYMRQIPIEKEFEGRRFSELFKELAQKRGRIALGIYRTGRHLNNRLPFVITNPLPSLILESGDLVFVI